MSGIHYTNDPRAVLIHFNANHDRLGRFAKNGSGSSKSSVKSVDKTESGEYNKDKPIDKEKLKKYAKIGAGVLAASLVVAGGIYLSKTGKLDKYIDAGKRLLNKNAISDVKISELYSGGVKTMKSNVGKSFDKIDTHMIASINKAGLSNKRERTINCSHCSVAYILNSLFGMSVKAKPFSGIDEKSGMASIGRDKAVVKAIFDGVEEIEFSRKAKPKKLLDTIEKNPNRQQKLMSLSDAISMIKSGTTGILAVATTDGGHLMNYEKDSNGLLTFVDSQANRIVASSDILDLWDDVVIPISAFDCTNASIRAEAWEILKNMIE